MKKRKYSTPDWLVTAMRGVAFWVGHRRSLYHRYPLGESALIAEFCNLIFANLEKGLRLECEVAHGSLFEIKQGMEVTAKTRTDLVIFKDSLEVPLPAYVFEVKRASASVAQIRNDLMRLLDVKRQLPNVSTFLVVVSEASRPSRYVDEKGKSIFGRKPIKNAKGKDTGGTYRVRRIAKAAHAFTDKNNAQYTCLLEVELKPKPKPKPKPS